MYYKFYFRKLLENVKSSQICFETKNMLRNNINTVTYINTKI